MLTDPICISILVMRVLRKNQFKNGESYAITRRNSRCNSRWWTGKRLYPLTKMRSKPAVPMAGKYRLIDIPISNCINSGIFRIAVLTQFNSVSLHRHIYRNYHFDSFHTGWVQIWAAEQTMQNADWYQGTADAVRKQLGEIRSSRAKYVLILAGDHLYRMDYAAMARFHW